MRDEYRPGPANSPATSDDTHWQERAEEAHAVAVLMMDPGAKATMLDLAAMYLAMARRGAARRARERALLGAGLRPAGAG